MGDSNKRPTAEIINPGLGDIEKVRDILFGKYVSSFEQQFADLEKRLVTDIDQLKQRLSDKIATMDEMVNQSIQKLDKQIAKEQKNRDMELKALQQMHSKAETGLQHAISMMEDQTGQDLAAVKANMETGKQELTDQVSLVHKELLEQLKSQAQELSNDKVGRQSLAMLLDEVALKLRGTD